MFELSTGLFVDRARVELSFRQRWNDLDQMFLSVTNYEGVAMEDRVNSTVTADTRSSIDHLAVRMLTVNAYYDFAAGPVVSPYLGAGVGPAFVTVAGVRFSDEYRDTAANSDVYDPPPCRSTTPAWTTTCPTWCWRGTCTRAPTSVLPTGPGWG